MTTMAPTTTAMSSTELGPASLVLVSLLADGAVLVLVCAGADVSVLDTAAASEQTQHQNRMLDIVVDSSRSEQDH